MPRTAVVTGASSGIGAATARALAGDGFHVVCAARRRDRVEALAQEIGGTAVVCDVTDADSVRALADAVPSLDVLVNNAGGAFDAATVEDADVDLWAQMYDVNVIGAGPGHPGPAPRAARRRWRAGRQHGLDRGPRRLRGRRWLHGRQARREGDHPDAAPRAGRRAAPVHRDRAGHGAHRGVRRWSASRATRRSATRSTTGSPSRSSPRTSPRPCAGSPRCRRTSTSTRSSSARAPRPPSTRCTGRSERQRRLKTVPRLFGGGSKGLSAKQLAR